MARSLKVSLTPTAVPRSNLILQVCAHYALKQTPAASVCACVIRVSKRKKKKRKKKVKLGTTFSKC